MQKNHPLIKGMKYNTCTELADGVSVCFYEAGHILGSAVTLFTIKDQADGGKEKPWPLPGIWGEKHASSAIHIKLNLQKH